MDNVLYHAMDEAKIIVSSIQDPGDVAIIQPTVTVTRDSPGESGYGNAKSLVNNPCKIPFRKITQLLLKNTL